MLALHTPKRRSTRDKFIFQRWTPATEEASIGPSVQPQDDTSANVVRESPSPADAEKGVESDKTNSGGVTEELGEDVDKQVNLEEKTPELDQDQARSDLGETHKSRPPPEQVFMDEDLARPDPGESRILDPIDRFRDLSEEDMKEMLHQRMFESGSYKSLPEHVALYEALEASMERAQRDEFLAEKDKSRK
ncbi:hypothetical protein Tco_0192566 [Tanacetum coccineum]